MIDGGASPVRHANCGVYLTMTQPAGPIEGEVDHQRVNAVASLHLASAAAAVVFGRPAALVFPRVSRWLADDSAGR